MTWFDFHRFVPAGKPKRIQHPAAEAGNSTLTPSVAKEMRKILVNWKLDDNVQSAEELLSNYVVPRR
jgi:hypothetical protein